MSLALLQKVLRLPAKQGASRQWVAGGLTLALVLLALLAPLPIGAAAPQARTINITAGQWHFQPGIVRVHRGDTVTINLESSDVVHGLFVDGYEVKTVAEPGRPGQLTFVADRDGAFRFRCHVACGSLHPFMIGKLVVEPNLTWWRAVAATVITAVGALVIFWRR